MVRALTGIAQGVEFEEGVAVGNDNVTIVLSKGKPSPKTIGHMSFHLPTMTALRKALEHLKEHKVKMKILATKSARSHPAHLTWAYGSTILMATAWNFPFNAESRSSARAPAASLFCP